MQYEHHVSFLTSPDDPKFGAWRNGRILPKCSFIFWGTKRDQKFSTVIFSYVLFSHYQSYSLAFCQFWSHSLYSWRPPGAGGGQYTAIVGGLEAQKVRRHLNGS